MSDHQYLRAMIDICANTPEPPVVECSLRRIIFLNRQV